MRLLDCFNGSCTGAVNIVSHDYVVLRNNSLFYYDEYIGYPAVYTKLEDIPEDIDDEFWVPWFRTFTQ